MTLSLTGGKNRKTRLLVFSTMAITLTSAAASSVAANLRTFAGLKHRLEGAAHVASVAALSNLPAAQKTAVATLELQGYAASTLTKLEYGLYDANSRALPDHFEPIANWARANAVRLTVQIEAPFILGGAFSHQAIAFLINPSNASLSEHQD